jgi:hypothetical protein
MSDTRTVVATWQWIGAALVGLAVVSACAPKVSRRQTDIMETSGKVSVSAAVLRVRVNDLVDRFAGRIERTADQILAEAEDDAIRRRALLVKVDVIPAVYTAGFRADPLAAAVDVWGLAFQFNQYVQSSAGRNAFGPQQPLALECARGLLADADALIKAIAIRPEYFDAARARVEAWAKVNLVEHAFSSRASGAALVADLRSGDQDVFVAVGAVSDLIGDLSERLNTYAAQVPKQARWQAEILVTGMTGAHSVESALGDMHEVGTAARRATDLMGDVSGLVGDFPALLAAEREILADERRAVLAGIHDQRVQTLGYMTAERLAILEAARDERMALVAALRQERIETLAEVDAIKTRAVDSALAGFRHLIDYTLWRVAALLVGLMLGAAVLAVLAYRLTIGRRGATVMS